jgi:DNA adenine methylase
MDPYFPDLRDYKEYHEPFIGGGSVAIHVTKKYPHLKVWVNDLHPPLATFWQQVQSNGYQMEKKLQELKSRYPDQSSAKGLFLSSKDYLDNSSILDDPIWTAISFYIVNKCSFSGLTQSSSFSKQASDSNFSMKGILKLSGYQQLIHNWTITNYSYDKILDESSDRSDVFVYLDPPYDIKDNLYGKSGSMHKGFDHDKFAEDCNNSSTDMMISYNSDQLVTNRFVDSKWRAAEFDLTYTMRSVGDYMSDQKTRKELLLMNYENRSFALQSGEIVEGRVSGTRLPGC